MKGALLWLFSVYVISPQSPDQNIHAPIPSQSLTLQVPSIKGTRAPKALYRYLEGRELLKASMTVALAF